MIDRLSRLLKSAIGHTPRPELGRDLWPEMLRRFSTAERSISSLDWLLAGAAAVWILLSPSLIPGLAYYL